MDSRSRDALYVGTDFGPGSLTASGYPRIVKEWKRGTPLAQATLVFEGKDVHVKAWTRRWFMITATLMNSSAAA